MRAVAWIAGMGLDWTGFLEFVYSFWVCVYEAEYLYQYCCYY